ncbi:MAG: alpha/beta hydrolase, partial [Saprospiraceae bacterium]|nr:alpha/beta hydrolase [Saprospiraceae bacterium]
MKNVFVILCLIFLLPTLEAQSDSEYLIKIGKPDSLYSKVLDENRKFWIQYPEFFNPNNKYPVLYVLDGSVHLPAVSNVHSYYSGGFMPEMIIVGVSNQTNRTRDLTATKVTFRRGVTYNQESGGADDFMQFISSELIPYVESKYPVTNYRTLIGHSYGGQFVINALFNHTDLFQNYIAIDPSLDWDNQVMLKQAKEVLKSKSFEGKSLFVTLAGQLHLQNNEITIDNVMKDTSEYTLFARSNIAFSKLLEQYESNGLNSNWKFYPNDLHGTIILPSILDGLIFLFKWFPIEHTDKFNSPETPNKELISIIRAREAKLKKHFGYDVPPFDESLFNMLGYMNMDMGQPDKALSFFQLNIEYNPESANAYDSLA